MPTDAKSTTASERNVATVAAAERSQLSQVSRPLLPAFGETSRQASLLFSAQTGSLIAGFGSSLLQARFMEPAEMGRFAFCLSIIALIGLSFEFGISSAGARVLALERDRNSQRQALGALLTITFVIAALFSLFILAAAAPIDALFKSDVRWLLIATAWLAFFQPLQPCIEQCCQGLNQIKKLSGFQLMMSGTYLALLCCLVLIGRLNAGTALAAYLGGIAAASIVTIGRLAPSFRGISGFVRLILSETRRFGLNLWVARIAGLASSRADQPVIKFFIRDTAPLGMYAIVQKFSNPILMLGRSLSMTRFKAFARAESVPARITRWNSAVLISAAIALITLGPVLVRLFFPRYGEAAWLLLPFAIANLFAGLFQPYNIFLASHGRGRELRNIVIVVSIASLSALVLAVPRFGITGAAWVAAAAMLLDYLLHLYYYRAVRRSLRAASGEPRNNISENQSIAQVLDQPTDDLESKASLQSSNEWKRRARELWTADPCGAHVARQFEFGSREYFNAIENYRYSAYAPWMRSSIGFDRFSGKAVLEVGCGTGTDLIQFARGGAKVTGVDFTPRSIEITRRRFEVYGLEADLLVGDAECLAFPDATFDLVYSFGVLHHTPNTNRAISEIHRVLRPGGTAIIMLYHRFSLYYWGGLMLKRGVFRGALLRQRPSDIVNSNVEHTESAVAPLVQTYTRDEARRLFSRFQRFSISVNQLTREELGAASRLMPSGAVEWLARHVGWNLLITASK